MTVERFDAYMERCLYGPDGFYTTHGVAGRARGDFITSPEVGPLFGAVVANVLDVWWEAAGRPDPWTVYDVGCGPNTLLKAVRRARPADTRPWRLVGVDVAADATASGDTANGEGDPALSTSLPDDLTGSVVLANELLDNLPFRIVERDGQGRWSELHVDDGDEIMVSVDEKEQEALAGLAALAEVAPDVRVPLLERAADWCRSVIEREPSHVCLFDYGAPTTVELAERGGWLRTYRKHERGHDPLQQPGRWDITTDIAADQLPPGATISTQAEFLHRWGIEDLVEEGRAYWKDHAARPDLKALAMRSRISEAEALTDPSGLGSWLVIHYRPSSGAGG